MKKVLPFFILFFAAVVAWGLFGRSTPSFIQPQNNFTVTTSFYPLSFLAKRIAKDHANIITITPSGIEPHDYEPTTSDISAIEKSKILIVNGNSFEPWADRIESLITNNHIRVVTASEGLTTKDQNESTDPHVWLDPNLAKEQVSLITQAFNEVDLRNARSYGANADELQKKLIELDEEFRSGLSNCKQNAIVTSHAAFGYLASQYGFTQMSVTGISPDEEPSARKIADIITFIRKNNIKYVFLEALVSPKISETIASETKVQTLVLNPLEGLTKEEEEKGEDYFSIQRKNLANLRIALECN